MKPEHERAKTWRLRHGWTMRQLAELTGYSESSILWMERGLAAPSTNPPSAGKPTNPYAWQRYRRVCHSVEIETRKIAQPFRWE